MEKASHGAVDGLESAHVEAFAMTDFNKNDTMICQVLVKVQEEKSDDWVLMKPCDVPDISDSIRKSWVDGMGQFIGGCTAKHGLQPLNFHLSLDGCVEGPPLSDSPLPSPTTRLYPSPYRIPPETITGLKEDDKVRRTELFALGSLIYEIYANKAPYEGLEDGEIQTHYRRAQFPDVSSLPQWPIVLSCWSVEFAFELYGILNRRALKGSFKHLPRNFGNYVSKHPYRFGLQCTGYAAAIAAMTALSMVPFVGPVAPGVIAGPMLSTMLINWIEAIEPVQAAILLALCRNAAMGCAKGLWMAGIGLRLRATSPKLMEGDMGNEDKEKLMELFGKVCRKTDVLEQSMGKHAK